MFFCLNVLPVKIQIKYRFYQLIASQGHTSGLDILRYLGAINLTTAQSTVYIQSTLTAKVWSESKFWTSPALDDIR